MPFPPRFFLGHFAGFMHSLLSLKRLMCWVFGTVQVWQRIRTHDHNQSDRILALVNGGMEWDCVWGLHVAFVWVSRLPNQPAIKQMESVLLITPETEPHEVRSTSSESMVRSGGTR